MFQVLQSEKEGKIRSQMPLNRNQIMNALKEATQITPAAPGE